MTDLNNVFIDTSPFIYIFDNNPEYCGKTSEIFERLIKNGVNLITSTISVAEFLVVPYRNKDSVKINAFRRFLEEFDFRIQYIDNNIAIKSAKIRSEFKFKAMDSLQLASAYYNNCDVFLTNDKQLKQYKEVNCVTIDDWIF